ncbi:hypothetical protein D3C72_1790530 [compost metagenome]
MVVVTVTGVRRSGARSCSVRSPSWLSQTSAMRNSCAPSDVKVTLRKPRTSRGTPRCASSARIWRLTADCVTCRSCAANVMLMRRPTATKPRTRSSGGSFARGYGIRKTHASRAEMSLEQ